MNIVDDTTGLRQVARDCIDWSAFADVSGEADPETVAQTSMADLVDRPFDLRRDPPYRAGSIELGDYRFFVFRCSNTSLSVVYRHTCCPLWLLSTQYRGADSGRGPPTGADE